MSSWIDEALEAAAIGRVFDALLELSGRLELAAELPPMAPGPQAGSCWAAPRPTPTAGVPVDVLSAALEDLWSRPGTAALRELIPSLTALADRLHRRGDSAAADPSPLVYPLF